MAKTILITGTSSGIGLASAKLFFEKGWNVIATMRSPENDNELKILDPTRVLVLRLDVQDLSSITSAVDTGIKKFGTIDLLVNNAGYTQSGIFETLGREQIQEQFDVNLFGLMDVIRVVLPHMRENNNGCIINIGSGAGVNGYPKLSAYSASKFALQGFTESLSFELASQNIFVKTVIPHASVDETNMSTRIMASLPAKVPPASYMPYIQKISAASAETMVPEMRIPVREVSQVIYEAATDGTDKLRYFIGGDIKGFVKARYESQSDEEYMAHMRLYF